MITEVSSSLYPLPEAVSVGGVPVRDTGDAVETVIETIQLGVPMARIEFLDEAACAAINAYAKLGCARRRRCSSNSTAAKPACKNRPRLVQEIAARTSGGRLRVGHPAGRAHAGCGRPPQRAISPACACSPVARAMSTDVCVPISRLAECILETEARFRNASACVAPIVGHVGDGNFHVLILIDPDDPDELAEAERAQCAHGGSARSRMDGTCTGEHGVGMHKMDFLHRRNTATGHRLDAHASSTRSIRSI